MPSILARSKKCVSAPKGWRTVYDFASAKLEKKNETAKKNGQKVREGEIIRRGEGIIGKRNGCI